MSREHKVPCMRRLIIKGVRVYQARFSVYVGSECAYDPTCSQYTIEALDRHGLFKGLRLGVTRLLRCRPGTRGGFDPVP